MSDGSRSSSTNWFGWRAFSGTAARTFRRSKFRAARIRPGGKIRPLRWSGRPERQQGLDRRDPASFADRDNCYSSGFPLAGAESEAGPRAAGRCAGTASQSRADRRNRATGKAPAAAQAAAARFERTHPRIEAPAFANQAIAFARRGLREIKFQKTWPERHLVEASAANRP